MFFVSSRAYTIVAYFPFPISPFLLFSRNVVQERLRLHQLPCFRAKSSRSRGALSTPTGLPTRSRTSPDGDRTAMSSSGSRPPSSIGMKRGSSVNVAAVGIPETVHEQVQSTLRIGDTVLLFSQEGQGFVYSDVSRCAQHTACCCISQHAAPASVAVCLHTSCARC